MIAVIPFRGKVRDPPFSTGKAGACGTGKNHPRYAPVFSPAALPAEAGHGNAPVNGMTPCHIDQEAHHHESIRTLFKNHRQGLAVEDIVSNRCRRCVRLPLHAWHITYMGGCGHRLFQGIFQVPV